MYFILVIVYVSLHDKWLIVSIISPKLSEATRAMFGKRQENKRWKLFDFVKKSINDIPSFLFISVYDA